MFFFVFILEYQYICNMEIDDIKDKRYYSFGENKTEMAAKAYWEKIKNKK